MNSSNRITSFPILLHFLLIIITVCPLSSLACHEEERRALLEFKSSLDDPSGRLSSWQESFQHRNCCAWHGIKCSHEFLHVVSIDLRNTKLEAYKNGSSQISYLDATPNSVLDSVLRGNLSPYLFDITHLEYLDLAFNDFQGSDITHQFSFLTKLAHLDLSFSSFSSLISTQFSNLTFLRYLDLSSDYSSFELTSTEWVRGLENLQVLRLKGLDLSDQATSKENFAVSISYLWNLRELDISECSISGPVFPIHEFHNLSHLSTLKMHQNFDFNSSIPLQLANLTSLSILDLSSCNFQGSIPYLPQLQELDVTNNHDLHTDLPRLFRHPWPRLQNLKLSNTNANGSSIPSSISNAPQLVSLSASYCKIEGSLPSSFYNLSRLQYLDLSSNFNLTGSIPSLLSNLKDLTFLDLSHNNFQGPIPKSFCEILPLQHLDLSYNGNNITGAIPSCITNLRNLSYFDVAGNSIGGEVPLIPLINELKLTTLSLGSNKLTVVIDEHLYPSQFRLESLQLESCNMGGFIPAFICNFTHLTDLYLSGNNLTGAVPSCISKLKLRYLDLSSNRLLGPLPLPPQGIVSFDISHNELSGEISLEAGERLSSSASYIYLNDNQLSGSIPSSLCPQKPGMLFEPGPENINLSHNKLSGTIPSRIGNCVSLRYLNLGNNNLSGTIPNELQKPYHLNHLLLSNNNLDGTFPESIQNYSKLWDLDLSNNDFEGIIPYGLGSLNNLINLSLRSNRFNGSIPDDITQLQYLQILDLSFNNFSGPIPLRLGNLTRLTTRRVVFGFIRWVDVPYQLSSKGTTMQIEQDLNYYSGIDLSSNILNGSIPEEIGLLQGLGMLNLSHNHFSSIIPASVGNMSSLESLDLSSNRLSGHIPQSLTSIDTLGFLSLSHNNLSGKIPTGNHFDTLSVNGSAFVGNELLCGFPLKKVCDRDGYIDTGDTNPSTKVEEHDQEDGKEKFLVYAIVSMGFAVGFWGLFFVLLLKRQKWWFPYWRIVDSVAVRIVECIPKKQQ